MGQQASPPSVSSLQELTLETKHDEPPLEVDTFIWLLPLSASLSPSPTAEDGRLWDDGVGRFPEDERFLVSEELPPPPPFSFWYSMGDWRATITQRWKIYIPLLWCHFRFADSPDLLLFFLLRTWMRVLHPVCCAEVKVEQCLCMFYMPLYAL